MLFCFLHEVIISFYIYLHLICTCTSLLGTDHYFSGGGGGGDEKLSSANIFFHFFFSILSICAKYYHCLIKLFNSDVQGEEGTQHEKRQKPLSSFVKKDLIDEAQESTHYIIEEEIHAPCGSESVNATLCQM